MITQLGNVTVVVSNLNRALKFYRDKLGLRLSFTDREHNWLCFDAGSTAFSLTTPWNRKAHKLVGARTGISFYVDDTMTGAWTLIGTVVTAGPLLPGQSEWVEISWMQPPGTAGTVWTFRVVVDDDGTGMGVHNECETGGEANNSALLASDCPAIG